MDYRKTAEEIYEKVGRRENLVSVAHCATRLRLVLADDTKCDAKAVEETHGGEGVVKGGPGGRTARSDAEVGCEGPAAHVWHSR